MYQCLLHLNTKELLYILALDVVFFFFKIPMQFCKIIFLFSEKKLSVNLPILVTIVEASSFEFRGKYHKKAKLDF